MAHLILKQLKHTGEESNGKLNLANSAAAYLALHSPLVLILLWCALMGHLILKVVGNEK